MRTVQMLAVSIAATLSLAAPARAQNPAQLAKVPPSVRADVQTAFMAEKLQLSPEEHTQVAAINLKYANQMQPILEGSGGPFKRMGAVAELETAKDGDLQKVLSPEQYQGYLAAKAELRQRLMQTAEAGGTGAP